MPAKAPQRSSRRASWTATKVCCSHRQAGIFELLDHHGNGRGHRRHQRGGDEQLAPYLTQLSAACRASRCAAAKGSLPWLSARTSRTTRACSTTALAVHYLVHARGVLQSPDLVQRHVMPSCCRMAQARGRRPGNQVDDRRCLLPSTAICLCRWPRVSACGATTRRVDTETLVGQALGDI